MLDLGDQAGVLADRLVGGSGRRQEAQTDLHLIEAEPGLELLFGLGPHCHRGLLVVGSHRQLDSDAVIGRLHPVDKAERHDVPAHAGETDLLQQGPDLVFEGGRHGREFILPRASGQW